MTAPNRQSIAMQIASTASPKMVGTDLANDLFESITIALKSKAIFSEGSEPTMIFRDAIAKAITNIEERAILLRRFLRYGPYEYDGDTPLELEGCRLTDAETSKAITFIYSHVVNCFQGQLAELLAAGPCVQLVDELRTAGRLHPTSRLYIGDSVLCSRGSTRHYRKAADMHIISMGSGPHQESVVQGVVEVKSYSCSANRLRSQLARHIGRIQKNALVSIAENGVRFEVRTICAEKVFTIGVTPARWKIPRTFSIIKKDGKTLVDVDAPAPPKEDACVTEIEPGKWHIVLRWSQEALASVAYEMTFWYMEKLGEEVFAEHIPSTWNEMTPAEAGRNAAKMMLYYAIHRCLSHRVEQRAVALYNTYGFGYALGMNFRNAQGCRQMLWPQDLREIAEYGSTTNGCSMEQMANFVLHHLPQ